MLTTQEWLTAIIALGSFLASIALLVVNLKVQNAMGQLRSELTLDMKNVELQVANMRTEAANDRASLYERIMENMGRMFINREASEAMHRANSQRLDAIETKLTQIDQRIDDIG